MEISSFFMADRTLLKWSSGGRLNEKFGELLRKQGAPEHDGPDGEVLLIQQHRGGLLPCIQAAGVIVDADGAGGIVGGLSLIHI